jgi:dihydroorotase
MNNYLIKAGTIVNEGKKFVGDVLILNGRIEKIASTIDLPQGVVEVNAEGKYVLPGFIDDQVHFIEPRLKQK